jgi:hypothetical protein
MERLETVGTNARSANRAVCSPSHQRLAGRLTLAGVAAVLVAAGVGWGLYLSWDWLAAAGLLTAVLILLACGAMCTVRLWSRWFGGGRHGAGEPNDSPRQPSK